LCVGRQKEVKVTEELFGANLRIFFTRNGHFAEKECAIEPVLVCIRVHRSAGLESDSRSGHDQYAKRLDCEGSVQRRAVSQLPDTAMNDVRTLKCGRA
jgi:hypothetical protein